jgi:hypothetical protein
VICYATAAIATVEQGLHDPLRTEPGEMIRSQDAANSKRWACLQM